MRSNLRPVLATGLFAFLLAGPVYAARGLPESAHPADPVEPAPFAVLTYHDNNMRTGADLHETRLTPGHVNDRDFGKVGFFRTHGKVDAEPLYDPSVRIQGKRQPVLYVATEEDRLYAFNAVSGKILWKDILLKPGDSPSGPRHCSQVVPVIGITSTPVIDPHLGRQGTIFAVAMSKNQRGRHIQRLYALSLATGRVRPGGPVTIQARFPGTGAGSRDGWVYFDPAQYKERAALLLLHGVVYTSWASHCDHPPYTGWVIGYNARTLKQDGVIDVTPNGNDGAIWSSGAGPAAGAGGHIYFLDGNGSFDPHLNRRGFPRNHDFGNAFIRLTARAGRLWVSDYFNMDNTRAESRADEDFGSGGALVLPVLRDRQGRPVELALGAGKDGIIYVVNRQHMGHFSPKGNPIWQEIPHALDGPEFGMPAYFDHRVYFGAVGQPLKAFAIHHARLSTRPVSVSQNRFVYPGTTPSISADGRRDGIVWAVENSNPAVLYAYAADHLREVLFQSNAQGSHNDFGPGNKFITPMIADGRVYIGTRDGVAVFGLLPAPSEHQQSPGRSPRSVVETSTFRNPGSR